MELYNGPLQTTEIALNVILIRQLIFTAVTVLMCSLRTLPSKTINHVYSNRDDNPVGSNLFRRGEKSVVGADARAAANFTVQVTLNTVIVTSRARSLFTASSRRGKRITAATRVLPPATVTTTVCLLATVTATGVGLTSR